MDKFGIVSRAGSSKGLSKPNQDRFISEPNFYEEKEGHLFGVLDGHGLYGHLVSDLFKNCLPDLIKIQFDRIHSLSHRNSFLQIKSNLIEGLNEAKSNLSHSGIDYRLSGSTCNLLYIQSKKLYCLNIGDSRSVLYSMHAKENLICTELSQDHKPCDPLERKRIIESGGRVQPA